MAKTRFWVGVLAPAALALAIPIAAQAQTPGTNDKAAGDDSNKTDDSNVTPVQDDKGEVIVITGTTIARKETMTAAPVAVLDRAEIDASGMVSIGEILQNLPSQSNAINVQFNNGGSGATRISLRGLGSGRTLVLVNGRRFVPGGSGANSSVDLNAIPVAVIERVEVLKDGASAVYGSDAIGGVVNIITKDTFQGTQASLYTGTTTRGGGAQYDVAVTSGIKSAKGSVMFSAGYFDQRDIMAGQRTFSKSDKDFDFQTDTVSTLGSSATPNGTLIDQLGLPGNAAWDNVIGGSCTSGACIRDSNGWRDFAATVNADVREGDFYNYQPENYLLTPQRRYNMWAQGNYKLHDNVKVYFESNYTKRRSSQLLAPTPLFTISEGITVTADNYYNPFGRDFIDIRRRMVEQGNRFFSQDIDTFRVVGGLKGKLPESTPLKNWRWDMHYNFGRTSGININEGRFIRSRVINAIGPSFVDTDGSIRCGTPAAPVDGCVPLNLFGGAGSITQDQLDYISYTGVANGYSQMHSVRASANGKVVDLPTGGDVRIAFGTEFRDVKGGFLPDPITASGDTTGNKEEPTQGGYNVIEGYGELSAVLATNKPWAKWLEINAAARFFDYNTFGSDFTYKVGGLWKLPQGVAIRGTYSTAFRAPAVAELFAGQIDSFPLVSDPCDTSDGPITDPTVAQNCAADGIPTDHRDIRSQLHSVVGGNPDLKPETANIITAGLVVEPKQVKGLAVTLDYWNIDINKAITAIGAGTLLSNCYARTNRSNCGEITRDPTTHLITLINDTQTNIGGNKTAGIDFQVRYDWTHTTLGRFRHNLEGTYLINYDATLPDSTVIKGKGVYDLGVFPEWRANFSTLWGYKDFGAGYNLRYIGSFQECQDDDCATLFDKSDPNYDPDAAFALQRKVKFNITMDLFLSYAIKNPVGKSQLTVGVNNLLDQDPAVIYNGFLASSDASTYDFLGRYVYARFSQSF